MKSISITLVHEPEMRSLPSGDRVVMFRGTQPDQSNPTLASYTVPPRAEGRDADRDAFDGLMRNLGGGDKLTLAGQWSKRNWKDSEGQARSAWEFKTQHFAQGDMSLEKVLEKARIDRGEVVAQPQPVREQEHARGARAAASRADGMGI